jgi:glycosyltransferase involved in cell wall biosynthesis
LKQSYRQILSGCSEKKYEKKNKAMRVSVSCPTKFHAFYLADQLHRHGALKRLYTSFYGRWGKKSNNQGMNIPINQVKTNIISASLQYGYNPGTELFKDQFFGRWAANQLSDEHIVTTWGLSALPVINRAHQLGIIAIVERGSSHGSYQRDILLEEYEKWGASTETLRRSFTPARIDLELLEYELADYIAIPSSFVQRTFLEKGFPPQKLIKVPYGVDLSSFRQLPRNDTLFRVVFGGAMSLQKGVHYLLQAFAELKLPGAELWLVGGKTPEIEPFFNRYAGTFRYFGQQPQASLHEFYSRCSVFCICSIQEGMAMVQLQGMACGLPLICTSNTGGDDLIEDGREGFIVPIRDVDALKERILYLYEHQDICFEMGQAAKCKVQQGFTWDDYGNHIIHEYECVLGNLNKRTG